MGGALEAATRQLFDSLDRKDAESIIRAAAEDKGSTRSLVDGCAASTSLALTPDNW